MRRDGDTTENVKMLRGIRWLILNFYSEKKIFNEALDRIEDGQLNRAGINIRYMDNILITFNKMSAVFISHN